MTAPEFLRDGQHLTEPPPANREQGPNRSPVDAVAAPPTEPTVIRERMSSAIPIHRMRHDLAVGQRRRR